MEKIKSDPVKVIYIYLPPITEDDRRLTNETLQSFRTSHGITQEDYAQVTRAHHLIFRRHLLIDPVLRRTPRYQLGAPTPEPFPTRDEPISKSEAKQHLVTIHRILDSYQVPQKVRRPFFKALKVAWYFIRLGAMADLRAESVETFQ